MLYPLATPVTEERGYIEMPSIPVGAEISIPELDDLGVKHCVDASARDLAMMWYDRARGEYADRLDGLDDDLVDTYGEIISANARIDGIDMNEDYDQQVLNGTYAGRNIQTILGTNSFDATISALHSRIASANFSGLRVGDFINVNCGTYGTVRFDIAHFDPYYQMGSSAMGHHICFVAHKPIALPSGDAYGTNNTYLAWNTTNTNQGTEAEPAPYLASHLHDWEINKLLPAMPTSLTDNLINRWEYLETRYAAAGGLTASTGRAWKQLGKVWSLSEMEVYGAVVWGTPGQSVGIDRQFDIFRRIWSQLHGERTAGWLRTPSGVSASNVCCVNSNGIAHTYSATYGGVRPRPGFLLG